MPPPANCSDRFLPRIRAELDKLPLSEEQKARAIPKIQARARFLDSPSARARAGHFAGNSGYFDFASKIRAAVAGLAADGLTMDAYLRAAVKHSQLFYQSPATTIGNIAGVAERFAAEGLTARGYLKTALKQPTLFTR